MSAEGITYLDSPVDDPRVIGFALDGRLTGEGMKEFVARIEALHADGKQALLLADMSDYEGFELAVVKEKLAHMGALWKGIEKYAVVGAKRWMEVYMDIVDPLTPAKLKHFEAGKRDDAFAWLLE